MDIFEEEIEEQTPCYYLSDVHLSGKSKKKALAQLTPLNHSYKHTSAPGGVLVFDNALVNELAENFQAGVVGKRLPVGLTDENGRHLPHSAASPAWITDVKRVGDGIDVELELANPQLAAQVATGEISLLSAEIDMNFVDKETGRKCRVIRGACFTPTPYIPNLRPAECINLSELRSRPMPELDMSEQMVTLSAELKDAKEQITQLSEESQKRAQENALLAALIQRQEDERVLLNFSDKVPPAALAKLSSLMELGRGTVVHLSEVVPAGGTNVIDCSDTTREVTVSDMAVLLAEEIASLVNLSHKQDAETKVAKSPYSADTTAKIERAKELQSKGYDLATATKLAHRGQ